MKKKPASLFEFIFFLLIAVILLCTIAYPAILWGKGNASLISIKGFFFAVMIISSLLIVLFLIEVNRSHATIYKYSSFGNLILDIENIEKIKKLFTVKDLVDCTYENINDKETITIIQNADDLLDVSNKKIKIILQKNSNEATLYYELQIALRICLNSKLHRFVYETLSSNHVNFREYIPNVKDLDGKGGILCENREK